MCPTSEDVWLEASRLQTPENAKAVLARGVAALPHSTALWMQVCERLYGILLCRLGILIAQGLLGQFLRVHQGSSASFFRIAGVYSLAFFE